jgi:Tfp pilus assembly protein PilX
MNKNRTMKQQEGAALVIGVILLMIISVIGITSMKSALLQDRMASGLKNRELADAAAMSLLVEAERWLFDYYIEGNAVALGIGSPFMLSPRSDEAYKFRTERSLVDVAGTNEDGWDNLIDINAEFGGILAKNPKFIIEPQDEASFGGGAAGGGTSYGITEGEADDGSAGSTGGSSAADGTEGGGKLSLYRIVVKATDTTGHVISAFESVMSVKVR